MHTYKHLGLSKFIGCLLVSLSMLSIPVLATAEVNPSALQNSSSVVETPTPGAPTTGIVLGVVIDKIELIKSAGRSGDELYFSLAQYSTVEKPKILNIPEPPMHWLSKYVSKIKDVVIWKKSVVDQEKVKLTLSLVEMENPPWNPDALIGVFDIDIKNDKGKISIQWEESSEDNDIDVAQKGSLELGTSQTIEVKGNHSDYKLTFKVKNVN